MNILYLDCAMGAAGDMLMAALLELLPDKDTFLRDMNALGLPGIEMCQPIADTLTFFISVPFLLPFLHKLNQMEEA